VAAADDDGIVLVAHSNRSGSGKVEVDGLAASAKKDDMADPRDRSTIEFCDRAVIRAQPITRAWLAEGPEEADEARGEDAGS